MAFAVTAQVGLKKFRTIGESEVLHVPVDPGVTVIRDNLYSVSGGVLIAVTDSLATPHLRADKGRVVPAATQPFPKSSDFLANADDAEAKTLVGMKISAPAGTDILEAKIKSIADETVVSYVSATRAVECTTGFGADDRPNGALAYVYEGPGIGEVNVVEDYDHTGGAAELLLIFHRKFKATLTTASKFIVFGSTAAANSIGFFGRMDAIDSDELDILDGIDDGDYVVCGSWKDIAILAAKGHLPVVPIGALT